MDDIATSTDVDALFRALQAARATGDDATARAVKARMADLQRDRRFGHLSDEELDHQIALRRRSRAIEPVDYAAQAEGWSHDSIHVRELNDAMEEAVGEDAHLRELQAERARRRQA